MLVEEVQGVDEQTGELTVTDYKFTNHLIHDAGHGSVRPLSISILIVFIIMNFESRIRI